MRPERGEGAGMPPGADAHLMISASSINPARFKSERLRAGDSGDLLVRRQETAHIIWPSTHANVQQSAQLSLIERSESCTIRAWAPGELSTRFDNPSWKLGSWNCDSNATCERLTVRGRRGSCSY